MRSPQAAATAWLLLRGWPGSVVEFLDNICPFTDPGARGGDPADAFHLVIPSLPGFGFSTLLSGAGWTPRGTAEVFTGLMTRLGYRTYGVQGGDIGVVIAPDIARLAPHGIIGVYVNAATGGFSPYHDITTEEADALTDLERARLTASQNVASDGNGYLRVPATRPFTFGYALHDSTDRLCPMDVGG